MNFDVEIIGIIGAILTTSGFVPQVYKTLKTRTVEGVSLTMYLVLLVGMIFWFVYGLLIDSFAIILANAVSGILVLMMILFRIVYRDRGE